MSEKRPEDLLETVDGHVELHVPDVTWYKQPGLRKLYAMMPIFFLGSTLTGYDGSLLNGLQTMDSWQNYFDRPSGARVGLFSAIQNIGGFCAVFLASYAADIFGRRMGVSLGLVVVIVGTLIQVVPSVTEGMFIGGRFLVGFGSNFAQTSAPLLIIELAHPAHRGPLTTMYNTLWYLGSIIAAWTCFGTVSYTTDASWRIPVGLQALMLFVQFVLIWITPESPRWLVAKDRSEEAKAILTKYHADGRENDSFVDAEFIEIQETIRQEQEQQKQGWDVFLRTPGNRKRLLLIVLTCFFSQCSGNGLVSYYLAEILKSVGITSSYNQALINGGLQLWSFFVATSMALTVDKLGRRKLFLTAAIGMLITFTIWTACSAVYEQKGNTGAGSAVIAMIFLFYGAAGFAWPGLTVSYSSEILPYNIRAKGVAIAFSCQALASVINQYINPIGLESIQWKFYFVYIVILVAEVIIIYFLYPETRGPTLEEIAVIFDGPGAAVGSRSRHVVKEEEVQHFEQVEKSSN
ncbi:lactose permease-like protein 2 [Elsinoe australis]|uniref:Lactose permease-like protein 2 n=1 Tax=Elsinoe australis TaxID=40998 RepID=A0A4V6DU34_9PEZI|nr:lactose permease-like protein 2 [Elsinoe australis]